MKGDEKLKRLLAVSVIVMALLTLSMLTAVSRASAQITIDGVISAGEWDEATSFSLNTYTVYITNDFHDMYVAFDYPVTTGSDFASFNTYKQGTFDSERINAPCVTSWGPTWDTITDENGDGVPETWSREDPTAKYDYVVNTATEIRVPLEELGLIPGDTIKLMFVLNAHMIGTYVYPAGAGSFDLNTYEIYALPIPPVYWFKASGGGVSYSDVSGTEDDFCTIGVIGMSLETSTGIGELVPCKGSGSFIDHDLKIKMSFDFVEGGIMRADKMIWFYGTAKIFDIEGHAKYYDVPVRVALVDDQYGSTNRFDVQTWGSFPMHWHGTLLPDSEVTVWVWEA